MSKDIEKARFAGLMMPEEVDAVLNNPATSGWLAMSVFACSQRDVVDALNDAEVLVEILKSRQHYGRCGSGERLEGT